MIYDRLANSSNYYINKRFVAAFDFLKSAADLPCGRHEIDEGVFANIMEFNTKPQCEATVEAHINYIDIQYIVSGTEQFGYAHDRNSIALPYDASRDIMLVEADCQYVRVNAGEYAIFFPSDYHAPSIGEGGRVKKIVVKVAI